MTVASFGRNDHPVDSAGVDELAECLYRVAHLFERQVTREALTSGLPLIDGKLTPDIVPRAAQRAGLQARVIKTSVATVKPGLLPAILLMADDNACVLMALDRKTKTAQVVYPELGEALVNVALSELEASYSGRMIMLKPVFRFDDRTQPVQAAKGHWFWSVIRRNRRLYLDILFAAVIINLFALAMPLFVMNVYDRVVPNQVMETLWVLAIGVFIVLTADGVLRTLRTWFVDRAAQRADGDLSSKIMEQVLGLRMEYRPASAGSFASTLQAFESVRSFISSAVVVGLVDLPFVLLFATIIALIGVPLVLPVVGGAFAVLVFALIMQRRMQAVSQESMRASAQRNASLVESLVSLETVRGFQAESRIQNLWERTTDFLSRLSARNRLYSASIQHFAQWAQHSVAVAVIIVGVYLITQGELTQGGLLAAYLLSSRAMAPISQTAALLAQYHQSATALGMLDKVMALPTERPVEKQWVSRPNITGQIEFRNVTFRYPDEPEAALRNVSFTINAGEHVAILGRNGSGKSTVHKLVEGFYQPSEGAILIDGVDLRQFDPAELRRQLGYVPQDVTLFHGSVLDNITLGHPEISTEKLHQAAALSGLNELLDKHPKGYELPVGERGQLLSGGQRQSVGLARAFARDPAVLLLDEPTAAMDHSSEEEIKASLKQFSAQKTLLLVTHRTTLLDLVERIIVIDNGAVLADGPKADVVQALRSGQIRRSR